MTVSDLQVRVPEPVDDAPARVPLVLATLARVRDALVRLA
jgi:hypothetical protein